MDYVLSHHISSISIHLNYLEEHLKNMFLFIYNIIFSAFSLKRLLLYILSVYKQVKQSSLNPIPRSLGTPTGLCLMGEVGHSVRLLSPCWGAGTPSQAFALPLTLVGNEGMATPWPWASMLGWKGEGGLNPLYGLHGTLGWACLG